MTIRRFGCISLLVNAVGNSHFFCEISADESHKKCSFRSLMAVDGFVELKLSLNN